MSAKETHFDVRADSTGAQAKLRNQRGPWLEITAATWLVHIFRVLTCSHLYAK